MHSAHCIHIFIQTYLNGEFINEIAIMLKLQTTAKATTGQGIKEFIENKLGNS